MKDTVKKYAALDFTAKANAVAKHPIECTYVTSEGRQVTRDAYIALRAAQLRGSIGNFAARQYFLRHTGARTLRLYRIACQLLAIGNWHVERNGNMTGDY